MVSPQPKVVLVITRNSPNRNTFGIAEAFAVLHSSRAIHSILQVAAFDLVRLLGRLERRSQLLAPAEIPRSEYTAPVAEFERQVIATRL
jgi:hypothetical protein